MADEMNKKLDEAFKYLLKDTPLVPIAPPESKQAAGEMPSPDDPEFAKAAIEVRAARNNGLLPEESDRCLYTTLGLLRIRERELAALRAELVELRASSVGVRDAVLREAVEAVRGERLECHNEMMSGGGENPTHNNDVGYSYAMDDAETAILALIPSPPISTEPKEAA